MSDDSEEDHGIGEAQYDEEGGSNLVEDDEMAPHEEGFMQGYEAANEEEPESVRLEESDEEQE